MGESQNEPGSELVSSPDIKSWYRQLKAESLPWCNDRGLSIKANSSHLLQGGHLVIVFIQPNQWFKQQWTIKYQKKKKKNLRWGATDWG